MIVTIMNNVGCVIVNIIMILTNFATLTASDGICGSVPMSSGVESAADGTNFLTPTAPDGIRGSVTVSSGVDGIGGSETASASRSLVITDVSKTTSVDLFV